MFSFKAGRLPNDPTEPRLALANLLEATPTFPEHEDWLSKVQSFPMYLNDQIGDCTCAAAGHVEQVFTTYGQGHTVTISDNDVLKAYEAVSGYDPATGANDNGAVMQHVLNYWRKTGFGGHKILAFAEVNIRNLDELRRALALFGTLYVGINFPDTAMNQFNAGSPWDVVPGARNEGGHCINAGYYDVSDNMWKVVTWGRVQPMTQAFWDEYVDEAWVVVSPEWVNAAGTNPAGISMTALGQAFTEITGEANPFPTVVPSPAPGPNPVPVSPPAVSPEDKQFIAEAKAWVAGNHFFYKDFQAKLRAWLATK